MPVASIACPMAPPSASISRTICPLATPPIAGLQLIWRDGVAIGRQESDVGAPIRAAASAASTPAWPAPITSTSYVVVTGGHTSYRIRGQATGDRGQGTDNAKLRNWPVIHFLLPAVLLAWGPDGSAFGGGGRKRHHCRPGRQPAKALAKELGATAAFVATDVTSESVGPSCHRLQAPAASAGSTAS